jgi:hypothetical protein
MTTRVAVAICVLLALSACETVRHDDPTYTPPREICVPDAQWGRVCYPEPVREERRP